MLKFDALPQLAIGNNEQGTGRACIMNAISYLNGDTIITDTPGCVWTPLARMAQAVNDAVCQPRHWEKLGRSVTISNGRPELLCPSCTHQMWMFGAELIGSNEAFRTWWNNEKGAGKHYRLMRLEISYRLLTALLRKMSTLQDGWPVEAELVERCMAMPVPLAHPDADDCLCEAHGGPFFAKDDALLCRIEQLAMDPKLCWVPATQTFVRGLFHLAKLPHGGDDVLNELNFIIVQFLGTLTAEQLIPAALAIVDEFMAMTKHAPIYPTYDEIDAMAEKVGLTAVTA